MKCLFEFKDLTCAEFDATVQAREPSNLPEVNDLFEAFGLLHEALRCAGMSRSRCASMAPEEPK